MKRSTEVRDDHSRPLTVVLAEDDEDLRAMLAVVLRRDGHSVVETGDGARLAAEIGRLVGQAHRPALEGLLIISDVRMPRTETMKVLQGLAARGQLPPFVLITAYGDQRLRAEAALLGCLGVFDKPFDFDELRQVVAVAARRSRERNAGSGA